MALESDCRTLAGINIEPSHCFVVASDGSGAYFFVHKRKTFTFVNFESGEPTDLTLDHNCFIESIVAFDKYECDFPETTIFVGIVLEGQLQKIFCTLFSASLRNKTVSVIEQLETNFVDFS
jgi:hypothetical protein